MNRQSSAGSSWRLLVFGALVVFVFVALKTAMTASAGNQPQDVMRLDNRITQLEQRLFSMETTLRNLDQQARLSNVPSRGVSQDQLARLLSDINTLQQRVTNLDCGVAKLDERTLTQQRRVERKRTVGSTDPCRLNFESPLP
jgi:hypothetical protein